MYKNYLWISHSAINTFDKCPQSYYYQYQYKNPKTGNRLQIVNPYFSLGLSVHQTIEELAEMSAKERVQLPLKERFEDIWNDYSGKKGGFVSEKQEAEFKNRGELMIERVMESDFLSKPAVTMDEQIPNIDLIPEKNIKLVGSLDWIQVIDDDSYHIIDFKTGKNKESKNSLQLPIYNILANKKLDGKVKKFSYWYLENGKKLTPMKLDSLEESLKIIKEKALEISSYVDEGRYPCNYNGRCFSCGDYRKIFDGEAEFLGTGMGGKDLFFIFKSKNIIRKLIDEEVFDQKEEKVFEMRMEGDSIGEISRDLNLSEKEIDSIVSSIKDKMAEKLSAKELNVLIREKLS